MRLAFPLLLLAACAPDLRDEFPFDGDLPAGDYVVVDGDVVRIDATFKESWVYVDLDGVKYVPTVDALGAEQWDLGFQRFKIITNSGVSGVGKTETAILDGQDFDALTTAPKDGYVKDAPDATDDADQDVDSPFLIRGGWYAYDLIKHSLQPRDVTYVVHTNQGAYFKLRMLGYYDSAGTSAKPSFRLDPVATP
jgi:hypothetical protein